MEALCATEVVREAFTRLFNRDESNLIFPDSDEGSDDDEDWEDNMDPLTFARYYAGPSIPHFVKMVEDHDRETRARLDHKIKSWAKGVVVSVDSELGAASFCKVLHLTRCLLIELSTHIVAQQQVAKHLEMVENKKKDDLEKVKTLL